MKFKYTIEFSDNTVIHLEKQFRTIPSDRSCRRRANDLAENELWNLYKPSGNGVILVVRVEIEKIN